MHIQRFRNTRSKMENVSQTYVVAHSTNAFQMVKATLCLQNELCGNEMATIHRIVTALLRTSMEKIDMES